MSEYKEQLSWCILMFPLVGIPKTVANFLQSYRDVFCREEGTELKLNHHQRTLMAKHAGTARHAYNWGLQVCIQARKDGEKRPSPITLHKRSIAEVKSANPWYYEVSKCAPQQALRDLDRAFQNFFTIKERGFPKFKKKGLKDKFYLEGNIQIVGNRIKLSRIGWVKTYEKHLPPIRVTQSSHVTISLRAGRWFVAYQTDAEPQPIEHLKGCVGVDLGVKTLATLSQGPPVPAVKPYRKAKKRLARLQQSVLARAGTSPTHRDASKRRMSGNSASNSKVGAGVARWHCIVFLVSNPDFGQPDFGQNEPAIARYLYHETK